MKMEASDLLRISCCRRLCWYSCLQLEHRHFCFRMIFQIHNADGINCLLINVRHSPSTPPHSSDNLARQWGLICLMLCHNLWGLDDVLREFFLFCFVSFASSLFGSLPSNMCKIVSGSNNQPGLSLKMHVSNELARQLTPTGSNFHIWVIIEHREGGGKETETERESKKGGKSRREKEMLKLLIIFLSVKFLTTTAIKLQTVCIYGREGGRLLQCCLLSWLLPCAYFSELRDSDSGSENICILVKDGYAPQSVFTVPANLCRDAITKGHPEPF